jgi:secreted trypsin-like serine protease
MRKLSPLYFFLIIIVLFFNACTENDDDSEDSNINTLDQNACNVLNLNTRSNTRIIDGTACDNLERSPVVRLVFFDSAGRTSFCSGSMITQREVLTAAHCFITRPTQIAMLSGDNIDSSEVYEAANWSVHPAFGESNNLAINDVAIIRLRQSVNLPTLPLMINQSAVNGEIVSIFGYGKDETGAFDFEDLESGEMRVSDVIETHIVAKFNRGSGSNTCQGDSGGPLISNTSSGPAISGITSSGTRLNCLDGDTSYFAKLSNTSIRNFLTTTVPNANYL